MARIKRFKKVNHGNHNENSTDKHKMLSMIEKFICDEYFISAAGVLDGNREKFYTQKYFDTVCDRCVSIQRVKK